MPPQMRQEMICLDMIYSQTTSVEIVDLPVSPLSASDSDFQGNETHGAEAYERILRVFQDALQILNQMVESDVVHLSSINHALADCSKNCRSLSGRSALW